MREKFSLWQSSGTSRQTGWNFLLFKSPSSTTLLIFLPFSHSSSFISMIFHCISSCWEDSRVRIHQDHSHLHWFQPYHARTVNGERRLWRSKACISNDNINSVPHKQRKYSILQNHRYDLGFQFSEAHC